jgi:pimeloyl-ACP methyl ester carboxylesterase
VYDPFPTNYLWWLNTAAAIDMGVALSDVDAVCERLRNDPNADNQAWFSAWSELGDRLVASARAHRDAGQLLSASECDLQAAGAYIAAERVLEVEDAEKIPAYERYLDAFGRGIGDGAGGVEQLSVPFEGGSLPALFVPACTNRAAPALVLVNGLDGTKELIYLWARAAFAQRGVALLLVDQPGVGGALRHGGLTCRHDSETYVGAAVDVLERRADVDGDRIGVIGISLGGYYAPRAAAFEERLKCCIAWGALWDLSAVLGHMIQAGSNSVKLGSHVPWVMGERDPEALRAKVARFALEDVVERIRCPLLIVHGDRDRQVEVWQARRTHERAVNAARRDLRIFTAEEGGCEHVQLDNMGVGTRVMADWAAEVLGASAG